MELFTTIIGHIIGILFLILCIGIGIFEYYLMQIAYRNFTSSRSDDYVLFGKLCKRLDRISERMQKSTERMERIRAYEEYKYKKNKQQLKELMTISKKKSDNED